MHMNYIPYYISAYTYPTYNSHCHHAADIVFTL